MKEKIGSLGRSAVVLAAIGIIAKLIGALYRVPLTNIVGAEGMGLYQMVFPLYTVLLAFCGGGTVNAVSRVVAKYTAKKNDPAVLATVRVAFVPLAVVSAVSALCLALFRNFISGIQGNTDASIAYLAIAPSLLFAGGISVLRGYFQGRSRMLPSGISQLIEQTVKLFLGLALGKAMMRYGVRYAVAGALIGVSAGELLAFAFLGIGFFVQRRKRRVSVGAQALSVETAQDIVIITDRELLKELYSFALPVTLGALVLPLTQMIDSALVINLLVSGGETRETATALFGLFVGPVGTLISMPSVVVVSVSIAFLPALTAAVERGDGAERITREATKWVMLFAVPVAVAFFAFPDRVCGVLYRRGLTPEQLEIAARLLRVQAVSVFYAGILQLGTAILQGYNKAHRPVINLVIGACVKVGLTPVLVKLFGIIGASGAQAAFYAVAATLTARSAYKAAGGICADIKYSLVLPVVASIAACLVFWGMAYAFSFAGLSAFWQTVCGAVAAIAVYGAATVLFGAIDLRKTLRAKKNRK